MIKVKNVTPLSEKKIYILFSDGTEKIIDIKPFIKRNNISSKLMNDNYFRKVFVEDGGGIAWPNGFDFCPVYLYENEFNLK
ncbi:MAG: DUF2442 domain-containing protein [Ignavibacteria bacterium]|nr:DUF2442 domain-containing protein [Ignavibacteria bacterium]